MNVRIRYNAQTLVVAVCSSFGQWGGAQTRVVAVCNFSAMTTGQKDLKIFGSSGPPRTVPAPSHLYGSVRARIGSRGISGLSGLAQHGGLRHAEVGAGPQDLVSGGRQDESEKEKHF